MAEAADQRDLKSKPSILGKLRNLVAGGAIIAAGTTAIEAATPIDPISNTEQRIENVVSDIKHNIETGGRSVDGKYLTRKEDGTFIITGTPQIVEIKFIPGVSSTTDGVLFQREPKIESGDIGIPIDEIKAAHFARIAGGSYSSNYSFGRFEVEFEGRTDAVGQWFMPIAEPINLTEEIKPIKPNGQPLEEGEKPYYVSGNFLSVVENVPEHSPTATQ